MRKIVWTVVVLAAGFAAFLLTWTPAMQLTPPLQNKPSVTIPLAGPSQKSIYRYHGFLNGVLAIEGTLTFEIEPGGRIHGTWELGKSNPSLQREFGPQISSVGNSTEQFGPQIGAGVLLGEAIDDRIDLRTTDIADYEVVIYGTKTANEFSGKWEFRDFVGVQSSGKFKAVLVPAKDNNLGK